MPIAAAAGIGAVGTIASAVIGSSSAKKAAKAQAAAAREASATQMKMYETMRGDLEPWRTTGVSAQDTIADLYGLKRSDGTMGTGFTDASKAAWEGMPDYKVGYDAGILGVNRASAANRSLLSGAHMKALSNFSADYANKRFNDYLERLYALSGRGQNAAAQTGSAALSTGARIGENQIRAGDAIASGYVGQANQITGAIGNITDNIGYLANRYGSSSYKPQTLY